jgi:hypothetical protein
VDDGIAMVEVLLGLPGMRVLEVVDGDDELVVRVETTASGNVNPDWPHLCSPVLAPPDVGRASCQSGSSGVGWLARLWA